MKIVIFFIVVGVSFIGRPTGAATFKVAAIFDMNTNKTVLKEALNGFRLASEEVNQKRKIIEVEFIDSGFDAAASLVAANKAAGGSFDIWIGETDSSKAMVTGGVAEKHRVPFITPFATSPEVTAGKKFVFRTCVSDELIGEGLARYAFEQLARKSASILYDVTQLYSKSLSDSFSKSFSKSGGSIFRVGKVVPNEESFEKSIREALEKKPEVLFLPMYEETVARLLNEALNRSLIGGTFVLGGDGWAADEVFKRLVFPKSEKLSALWVIHHPPTPVLPTTKKFLRSYEKKFGVAPRTSAAYLTYDAVLVAVHALVSRKPGEDLAEKIRDAKPVEGSSGLIHFNGKQDPKKPVYLLKLSEGSIQHIGQLDL